MNKVMRINSPERCLKLEKVEESCKYEDKVKQKLCSPFRSVCLFNLFNHKKQ